MDNDNSRRPTQRGGTAPRRERPVPQASRPRAPRPQTGTASDRARQRQRPQAEETRREPPRQGPAQEEDSPRRDRPRPRQTKAAPARPRPKAPTKARKKKPHRVYNTNFGFQFAVMLAVVAVIVLGMMIFFKVKHIRVLLPEEEGQVRSYYSAEEIIEASGINIDDNLLSLSKATVASRIHAALPYVNEIQVKKQLPGTVIITVSEFEVSYGIQDEAGAWWLMSREGRILEPSTEQEVKTHLVVTGMPIKAPQPGDFISPVSAEGGDLSEIAAKRSAALEVLDALEPMEYVKQLQSVDVGTSYDIVLWYGTQFEIRLGNTENLRYKLQYLQGVLEELGRDKSGTIDLSFTEDNSAHFLPFG